MKATRIGKRRTVAFALVLELSAEDVLEFGIQYGHLLAYGKDSEQPPTNVDCAVYEAISGALMARGVDIAGMEKGVPKW